MRNEIQYKIVIINHSNSSPDDFPHVKIDEGIRSILKDRDENKFKYRSSGEVLRAIWQTLNVLFSNFRFRISSKNPMTYINENGEMKLLSTLTVDVYDEKTIETASKIY